MQIFCSFPRLLVVSFLVELFDVSVSRSNLEWLRNYFLLKHFCFFSLARDCTELFAAGFKESGVYTVNPANKTSFEVYCDMTTDGGGWTVFHKRYDGFVGFYRDWDEYKNGFGDVRGEFWLGNEKIHQLTEIPSQLRVEINTTSAGNKYARYDNFTVTNEASNYTLFVGFYSGDANDQLTPP